MRSFFLKISEGIRCIPLYTLHYSLESNQDLFLNENKSDYIYDVTKSGSTNRPENEHSILLLYVISGILGIIKKYQ